MAQQYAEQNCPETGGENQLQKNLVEGSDPVEYRRDSQSPAIAPMPAQNIPAMTCRSDNHRTR